MSMKKNQIPGLIILTAFIGGIAFVLIQSIRIESGKIRLTAAAENYINNLAENKRLETQSALDFPLPEWLIIQNYHRMDGFDMIVLMGYEPAYLVYIFLSPLEKPFDLQAAVQQLNQKVLAGSFNPLIPKQARPLTLQANNVSIEAQEIVIDTGDGEEPGVIFGIENGSRQAAFIMYGEKFETSIAEKLLSFYLEI